MKKLLALAVSVAVSGPVFAESRPLNEVVVVGTRSEAAVFDIPYAVHRIDELAIRSDLYRTLPQALSRVPGVMVQETAAGQGSPYIRGFTGFRNLFLIDGVRLNNSVMRDGPNQYWATVDVHGLGRLEVLSGSAGALYGTDAVGGTVNAVTRDVGDGGTDVFLRLSDAEESGILRAQHDQRFSERFAASFGVTGKTFGDLEGGDVVGRQTGVGYEETGFDFKGVVDLNEAWDLSLVHQQVRQDDVPRTHKTVDAISWEGTSVGSELKRELDQERRLSYLRITGQQPMRGIQSAAFTISNSDTSETRERLRTNDRFDKQGFDVDTWGLTAQLSSDSPIGHLTWGAEFYRDDVDSFSSRNPVQGPIADDARYQTFDVYLQDELAISDRTDLILGLRTTRADADANRVLDPVTDEVFSIDEDYSETVGSVRLQHEILDNRLSAFVGVSEGFRAPNLSDLTRFDTARTDEFETPAPGLEPEEFLSHDLGLKWSGLRTNAAVTFFYTDIEDLIIRFPTGRTVDGDVEITKANAGDGYVRGLEFDGGVRLNERWTLNAAMTWMDGEVSTFPTSDSVLVDEPIDRLMPFTLRARVHFAAPSGTWWAEAEYLHADTADELSTRDRSDTSRIPPGGTPAFDVIHLRGGWRFNRTMRAILAVNNLFNEDYRIHGSGTNMPGRNVILAIEFSL